MEKRRKTLWLWVVIVVSNSVWAAEYFSQYLSCGYQQASLQAHKKILGELKPVVLLLASGEATQEKVVAAIRLHGPERISYETPDSVVIGDLKFTFDEAGALRRVKLADKNGK